MKSTTAAFTTHSLLTISVVMFGALLLRAAFGVTSQVYVAACLFPLGSFKCQDQLPVAAAAVGIRQ